MALLLKNGSFFFHVPKTGGTWVSEVLRKSGCVIGQVGSKHCFPYELGCSSRPLWHPNQIRDRVRLRLRATSPVNGWCFLRDPVSWYKSWFSYQQLRGWQPFFGSARYNGEHPLQELNYLSENPPDSFDEFLTVLCERSPQFLSRVYLKYLDSHRCKAIPYENLRNEIEGILVEKFKLEESHATALCKLSERNISRSKEIEISEAQINAIRNNESIFFNYPELFETKNNESNRFC